MESTSWRSDAVDESGLARIAAWLALIVKPGDVVTLAGDLGAGKTSFARALIRAFADEPTLDVPSPTFALVQDYSTRRGAILHADLYRLATAEEVAELGILDHATTALVLIEWPDRAAALLPQDRIDVTLEDAMDGAARSVTLHGRGSAGARIARLVAMAAFLAEHASTEAPRYLDGDASTRAYARLADALPLSGVETTSLVLMDWPKPPAGPPLAGGRSYREIVHLADGVTASMALNGVLRAYGLSAPAIIAADIERGFLLIEDLGDLSFARALAAGVPQAELYGAAVDVLLTLRRHPPPSALPVGDGVPSHVLAAFDREALMTECSLLLDWHWPEMHGRAASQADRADYLAAFEPVLAGVAEDRSGWVLRDFHSPNLLWLPQRDGIRRVGLIDTQDAMRGHPAYDLAALLQDARLDVPPALEAALLNRYCDTAAAAEPGFNAAAFRRAYAILGAQRAAKILGIFVRLWRRDGKPGYLQHLPRNWATLERNLTHPDLQPLRAWLDRCYPLELRGRLRV